MDERSIESDLHSFSDDNNVEAGGATNNIPNWLTLDTIEKAEKGIGLNGPFESLDEMLHTLNDDSAS